MSADNRGHRYDKIAIAISLISLAVSAVVGYANWSAVNQATNASNQAVSIANHAFNIANNYSYVEVHSSTPLILRPANCRPIASSNNTSCSFTGAFNVSFEIIAPHAGTYNVTVVALNGWGPFSPHPVGYAGATVRIGNATISADPPLQSVSSIQGGVPSSSSQPFEKTAEIEIAGFTLLAPSSSIRNLNFQGVGTLAAILTFSDLQEPGRNIQRLFIVQVVFLAK
ncbi:MAG: hypothetical protein ABSE39_02880 [Candidatus Bathyarchaeia archaeon]|jgi:hypothetical protein